MNFVAIHRAIEAELVVARPVKDEAGLPVLAASLRQTKSLVVIVDRRNKADEGVVHALKRRRSRVIKQHAAPPIIIGEER